MSTAPGSQRIGLGLPDQAVVAPAVVDRARATSRMAVLRSDLMGGVVAGLISIPASIGYALLAFAPLGEAFFPLAVRAGLVAVVIGCLAAAAFGRGTTRAYAPRSVVAFLISAILLQGISGNQAMASFAGDVYALFLIMSAMVALGGVIMVAFGLMRLGNLVKYMPAPVVAGFQNAAAILIFVAQIAPLCGFREPVPILSIPARAGDIQPLTLLVGVLTCVVTLRGARWVRGIPPTILGVICGIAAYYLLKLLGLGAHLGPPIGTIPQAFPDPKVALDLAVFMMTPAALALVPTIVAGAFSIAVVTSLDALLCARVAAADAKGRFDSSRELLRVGAGNFAAPLLGGVGIGINLASTFAGQRAGARTSLSVVIHAIFVLLCLLLLAPLIEAFPRVVIAGTLTAVAIQLVDRWTLGLIRALVRGEAAHRVRMLIDLGIILIVALIAIVLDLVLAVFIGVSVAVVFFVLRMSQALVRRAYRGDRVRSRKTRDPNTGSILAQDGASILVLELDGAIFFGTAERLADLIDRELGGETRYLILDLRLARDIDSTGARVLLQAHERYTRAGRYLLIAGLRPDTPIRATLTEQGVLAALTNERLFEDVDRALEWAEDRLLLESHGRRAGFDDFPLAQLDLLGGMAPNEISTVRSLLQLKRFAPGQVVFRAGDEGTELYLIVAGQASAKLDLGGGRELRLITFTAGTAFGELALLDQEARSATVTADDDLICYVMSRTDFVVLTRMYPGVAIKLLRNLARELSYRLRWANRTVFELDR